MKMEVYLIIALFLVVVLIVTPISYQAGARVPLDMYHKSVKNCESLIGERNSRIEEITRSFDSALELNNKISAERDALYNFIKNTYEFRFMAKVIECEAGGESFESKVSVACVILNRVASSEFPNTISEVLTQENQFTPVSNGIAYETEASPASEVAIIEAILCGDTTRGSLFFVTPIEGNTEWFEKSRVFVFEEENFRFYK